MRLVDTLRGVSYLAAAALGIALSGPAPADTGSDVVIVTQAPRLGPGAGDQIVSLTRRVSYADLDLSTYSGAKQLEERVHEVANTLCGELERRSASFPNAVARQACIKGAVADGMEHVRAAVAASQSRTHTVGLAAPR